MEHLPEIEDQELLAMIRQSPDNWKSAWRYLWIAHRNASKAVISKWVKDEIEQDEIFDRSLMDFRRKVLDGSYHEQSSIRTFLISICKRRCWQSLSRKKHKVLNMTDELQYFAEQKEDVNQNFLDDLYSQEESMVLKRVIQKIEGDCPQIIFEYYWQQLKQKEMAKKRGMVGASTIKNKLSKCREKMEELLKKDRQARELLDQKIAIKTKSQEDK